jgi:hypothetical protein
MSGGSNHAAPREREWIESRYRAVSLEAAAPLSRGMWPGRYSKVVGGVRSPLGEVGWKMRKVLLSSAVLVALIATPAMAADLPVRAPVYRAPPVTLYDWTGFYIGGHGGWAWTQKDWRDGLSGVELVSYTADRSIGGVQGGYNRQTGAFVVGVEAQSSWGEIRKGADWTDPEPNPVAPRKRTGTTVENLGTASLRFGRAFDRSLCEVRRRLRARCLPAHRFPGRHAARQRERHPLGLHGRDRL